MRQALLGSAAILLAAALPPGVVFAAAPTIKSLRDEAQALIEESEELVALADKEERELTDDELAKIEANKDKGIKLARQIAAREAAAPVVVSAGRRTVDPTNAAGAGGLCRASRSGDGEGQSQAQLRELRRIRHGGACPWRRQQSELLAGQEADGRG